MIISRAPFRVSFAGGGSDIPAFYEKYGGCVLSTTIKKYVYLTMHPAFNRDDISLKYSKTENVHSYKEIEHKIFHQAFKRFDINGVEIASMADVTAGTGLGSSSTFTVALLKLLYTYQHRYVSTYHIAKEACDIEITDLGNPIGKQDQFAAAFGGLKFYEFLPNGFVKIEPIVMNPESYKKLEDNCVMFYTGITHDANKVLAEQKKNIENDKKKDEILLQMCDLARDLKRHLEMNDVDYLGECLAKGWELKKQMASTITGGPIDELYEKGIKAGATGGKLLGAGGGGFLLFYVPTEEIKENVRKAFKNYKELPFELDNSGVSIIYCD
ncbi:MAG TPA: GHMP kinase [Firmicutes bacterium]|nr:GHMP kinase [Bacillota bacterium]